MRISLPVVLLTLAVVAGTLRAGTPHAAATFSVPEGDLPDPLVLVAYGDMRFTAPSETDATNPGARQALVAKIAAENPAAIFLDGDVPWHGVAPDYAVFRDETHSWRGRHPRGYPGPRHHEFLARQETACFRSSGGGVPGPRGRRGDFGAT